MKSQSSPEFSVSGSDGGNNSNINPAIAAQKIEQQMSNFRILSLFILSKVERRVALKLQLTGSRAWRKYDTDENKKNLLAHLMSLRARETKESTTNTADAV